MLKAASIGLGWWSDELAGAIQGKSDAIGIVSCFSRSPEKRTAFREKFDTAEHESYEAVLADPEIDAVLLTTPHSLHAEHIAMAAAAGKQVFVEKPMTLTAQSAKAAADACAKAGVQLAVGQNRRFCGVARAMKRMVEGGDVGTVLHIEGNFSVPALARYSSESWRANRTESPGGGLAGLGIHVIDLMCFLLGPIVQVIGQCERRVATFDMDDTTSALFKFADGPSGYLGTLMDSAMTHWVALYGTHGNLFARPDQDELAVQKVGEAPAPVRVEKIDTLRAELEAFAAACRGEAAYDVPVAEAVHDVAVMEAIVVSSAEGSRPIRLATGG